MTVLGGKKPLHTKYELSYATLDSCSEIQFPGMANVSGLLREYGEGASSRALAAMGASATVSGLLGLNASLVYATFQIDTGSLRKALRRI